MDSDLKALLINTALYPSYVCRTLIQLGHEPYAYSYGRSIMFWKVVPLYPNLFAYIRNTWRDNGIVGLYSGFGYRLMHFYIGQKVYKTVLRRLKNSAKQQNDESDDNDEEVEDTITFVQNTTMENISCIAGLIVTYPFEVLTVRTIAQLIGKETTYSSLNPLSSFSYILKNEGYGAFFKGIIPQIIGTTFHIWFINAVVHLYKRYAKKSISDKGHVEYIGYIRSIADMLASQVRYPLNVVSFCIMVNGCGLAAGQPPYMKSYGSWTDCYRHLSSVGDIKRGANIFGRAVPNSRLHEYKIR